MEHVTINPYSPGKMYFDIMNSGSGLTAQTPSGFLCNNIDGKFYTFANYWDTPLVYSGLIEVNASRSPGLYYLELGTTPTFSSAASGFIVNVVNRGAYPLNIYRSVSIEPRERVYAGYNSYAHEDGTIEAPYKTFASALNRSQMQSEIILVGVNGAESIEVAGGLGTGGHNIYGNCTTINITNLYLWYNYGVFRDVIVRGPGEFGIQEVMGFERCLLDAPLNTNANTAPWVSGYMQDCTVAQSWIISGYVSDVSIRDTSFNTDLTINSTVSGICLQNIAVSGNLTINSGADGIGANVFVGGNYTNNSTRFILTDQIETERLTNYIATVSGNLTTLDNIVDVLSGVIVTASGVTRDNRSYLYNKKTLSKAGVYTLYGTNGSAVLGRWTATDSDGNAIDIEGVTTPCNVSIPSVSGGFQP